MKTYIKFVNSIYKDMNMKDMTFKDEDWFLETLPWGITVTKINPEHKWERLYIPWNNIVVMQRF